MRRLPLSLLTVLALFGRIADVRADETLVRLPTRTEVTQGFLLEIPAQPKAAVLLFAGAAGYLGLDSADGRPRLANGNNFLVRSRHLFAQAGLIVATLDAPSDEEGGMDAAFRLSPEHAEDVAAVVAYLKKQAPVPVWLVGTSQGTLSATRTGARLGHEVDGVVLTSSISRPGGRQSYHGAVAPQGVLTLGLEDLSVPVLVVAHGQDACAVTPPDDAPRLLERLEHSPRKALRILQGGDPPRSGPCDALSAHGYLGIEPEAVQVITDFILGR
ncbi:alpha/beta hydrolase [Telmatospirillum siberiense]|uniref:Alpha/beta hydrolase n=1 Tax=Telmatospirillum siberiense TaxID=382514 RepID=A0A2N3PTL5_9PROT|nr:alpha/beta hydrolase [Telmatospirillum siberiense]PKU23739.1 alpha/beta hydrolase [Telmatospirillum siberiense]